MNVSSNNHHHSHDINDFKGTIKTELLVHLPYAILSVALGMIVLSFVQYFTQANGAIDTSNYRDSSSLLFHSFHFLHIIFAATGTMITYLRFSKKILRGIIIGMISTSFFCALSDVILPYLVGRVLGVPLHLHFCVVSELHNVLPFLAVGIINGFLLSRQHSGLLDLFSVASHFLHILISSFASIFYLFSHGFTAWQANIGLLFIFLIFAVVFPCTFSDVIVPLYFARNEK